MAKSKKTQDVNDPIAAEKIRAALKTPEVERAKIDLPRVRPPEELQRWGLRPIPKRGTGRSF